jgi:hypothetical protein
MTGTSDKTNTAVITIEQLNKDGEVFRTFKLHKHPDEVDATLARIERAYLMSRTRVTVQ